MGFSLFMDQRDRIQDMSRFMNSEGASSELMVLLYLAGGFLVLLWVLKLMLKKNQTKRNKR
ncbi:hypothetical protein ACFOND_13395 [Reinekea marina]|uniref:Uncharacterized protein n=2 Tax=Reinekea marina TaxID=1310421 RepID=A0ABV7WVT2_9GAMM|nr:hypothetical protein [Reinekea forsetii]